MYLEAQKQVIHFFEHIFVPTRSTREEVYEFEGGQIELPVKFDLDEQDWCLIYIFLKFKDSFDKAIRRYSSANSKVGDIIPIYQCLQFEVDKTCTKLLAAFGTDTNDGRTIGCKEDNKEFPNLVKDCLIKRYLRIAKDPLVVEAYLICGYRM